ncbi:MAG TPA: MFS transporter [Candidatus Lustribacter sp.]|nr:MFS transporter [Candidatus Lustribacter sp.]
MNEPAGVVAPAQRTWALAATVTASVLAALDQSIANTALPTIAHDLHTSASASIWVINAFQLGLIIGVVPLAAAGDILGYWRVFRLGLAIFVVASLACSLSHDLLTLTLARFVQGAAAAALTITATPINRLIFPANMVGRATGYNTMAVALGAMAGPIVSGVMLSFAPWQWLFALNVPIGAAVFVLALKTIPKTPGANGAFDWTSALMNVAMFGLAVLGFDTMGHDGPTPAGIGEVVVAAIVGWLFIRRQLATPLPMFAVDLFAQARFTLAVFACFASFVSQTIAYVTLPFAFQTVMGHTPLQVGALLLPWLLASAVMAPVAGPLADRYNSSRLAALGLAIFSIGLLFATVMGPDPAPADIAWRMAVCGIGYGLFQSPNNRAMQISAPRERSAAPQAIQGVARLLGQTTGAAIVALVFAFDAVARARGGISPQAVVQTLAIATAFAVIATAASVWRGVITGSIRPSTWLGTSTGI